MKKTILSAKGNFLWELKSTAKIFSSAAKYSKYFKGDVYLGLEAWNWTETDMDFARGALWILSGWYGILRPDTLIQPYRLEMGTALPIGRKPNLYAHWEPVLKDFFAQNLDEEETIVNVPFDGNISESIDESVLGAIASELTANIDDDKSYNSCLLQI